MREKEPMKELSWLLGKKGSALFSLMFVGALASPAALAAEKESAKTSADASDGGTLTVEASVADADAAMTSGYQPLSSSTATLTNMPLLDIPQVVNTVSDRVIQDQHATTLDEVLNNVSNVVQTNTLGGTQDALYAVVSAVIATAR